MKILIKVQNYSLIIVLIFEIKYREITFYPSFTFKNNNNNNQIEIKIYYLKK